MQPQILVVDLGSQYSLVIARTLRELGVRSAVLSPSRAAAWLKTNKPKGIILSGGSDSVYNETSPIPPARIHLLGVPVLGICYGMQWMAKALGGQVEANPDHKEYGPATIHCTKKDRLFFQAKETERVWASHGDSVTIVPRGFKVTARSDDGAIAAMTDSARKLWGLQFHPEVVHTKIGPSVLFEFLYGICKCDADWQPDDIVRRIRLEVSRAIGARKKAIIGFSGGVDSSTLAAILSPVFSNRLRAVCIDTGGLRDGEIAEIKANAAAAKVELVIVRASARFLRTLGITAHSEIKRKRFKRVYGKILEEQARDFGAMFIIQGSLATDFIESGRAGKAALIKSHHNIGLNLRLKELHPLRELFKYEVRELGRSMGLPKAITQRAPFPGPGLFVRVVGASVTAQRLAIVRYADSIVRRYLKDFNLEKKISQLVVGLDCTRTVGIKGDHRVYGYAVVVRAVQTSDFMTATGYEFPVEFRRKVKAMLTKAPEIVRVYWDETDKPPATTELE